MILILILKKVVYNDQKASFLKIFCHQKFFFGKKDNNFLVFIYFIEQMKAYKSPKKKI